MKLENNTPDAMPTENLSETGETSEQPLSPKQRQVRPATDFVVYAVCLFLLIYHMVVGRSTRAILAIMFAHSAAIKFDEHRAAGKKGVPGFSYFSGLVAVLQLAAYIF